MKSTSIIEERWNALSVKVLGAMCKMEELAEGLDGDKKAAEARAEKAEKVAEVLAEFLVEVFEHDSPAYCPDCWGECPLGADVCTYTRPQESCWLRWAAREAEKESSNAHL